MPDTPRRVKMFIYLLLSLSFGICLGLLAGRLIGKLTMPQPPINTIENQAPMRVVTIKIIAGQQEKLFEQMRKYADKWAYAIRIAPAEPNEKYFRVDLWRSDIKILGLYGDETLDLSFSSTDPSHPVPKQHFDEEIEDLKNFIHDIPGATLSVK